MKTASLLLFGAAAVAGVVLFHHSATAAPALKTSNLPPGWTPPDGAVFSTLPASNPTGVALDVWTWTDSAGNTNAMFMSHANPMNDYAVLITPAAGGGTQILTQGSSQISGLIAQAGRAGILH